MRKFFIYSLICAVSLVLLCACGEQEFPESVLSRKGIPTEIQQDFYARNGSNVCVTEAIYYRQDGSIYIYFEDPEGVSGQSEYLDGHWQLTLREFNSQNLGSYLPHAVFRTFKRLGFDGYCQASEDDRVAEFSRRGIDHKYYEFRFHTYLGQNHYAQYFVMIDEDGVVLENANSYFNRMDWPQNYDQALDFIANRYAGCDVRGLANDGGYDTFYVIQQGRLKRVRFQNNFQNNYDTAAEGWKETVWNLDSPQAVPEYVWEEFQTRMEKTPESRRYEASVYYYRETPRGNYYGLEGPVSETSRVTNWFAARD